jgi:hypothetical protein
VATWWFCWSPFFDTIITPSQFRVSDAAVLVTSLANASHSTSIPTTDATLVIIDRNAVERIRVERHLRIEDANSSTHPPIA